MKPIYVVVLGLVVLGLLAVAAIMVGRPIVDAQAVQIGREATPLQDLVMMRESRGANGGFNWPFVLLLMGVVAVVAFLGIGDRVTRLLRAVKGLRQPQTGWAQMPQAPVVNIEQLPAAGRTQLPARAPEPRFMEVDGHE